MKSNELKDFWNNEQRVKKAEKEVFKKEEIRKFKTILIEEKEEKKYKPTYLIIQAVLNTVLFLLSILISDIFLVIMFINLISFWLYALISVIKNDFKKNENKMIWIILIIFVPFSAFLYPDFKEIQVIEEEEKGFSL